MNPSTGPFSLQRHIIRLVLLLAAIAALSTVSAFSQTGPDTDPYQRISFQPAETCSVNSIGEVTYLIRNGVELSVREDWDCDRVPDAYDNCVAMPNTVQTDSNRNGIGDACEAAANVRGRFPVKVAPKLKDISRKAKPANMRQNASIKTKRSREKAVTIRRKAVAIR